MKIDDITLGLLNLARAIPDGEIADVKVEDYDGKGRVICRKLCKAADDGFIDAKVYTCGEARIMGITEQGGKILSQLAMESDAVGISYIGKIVYLSIVGGELKVEID